MRGKQGWNNGYSRGTENEDRLVDYKEYTRIKGQQKKMIDTLFEK